MKPLFLIVFIIFFSNTQTQNVVNGCGIKGYEQPTEAKQCQDSETTCCFVKLDKPEGGNINFCFPAPDKIELDDVKYEIQDNTGYTVAELTCHDFAENLKYMIGNLLLIGLILI